MNVKKIHWIGVGLSSPPGILHLINHGHNIEVWNRTTEKASKLLNHKININTIEKEDALNLKTNDIANISFKLAQPLIVDNYANHKGTGAFIIVDETTFHTVGAGMINSVD